MKIKTIQKLPAKYKGHPRPAIAVAGRSNVGKSTLINKILGTKIAKTSKTPGRTRGVHRFLINEQYDLVDLPGYGFAKVGVDLRMQWRGMVTDFLSDHGNLQQLLVLVDIRRGIGEIDLEMLQWADSEEVEASIILTSEVADDQGIENNLIKDYPTRKSVVNIANNLYQSVNDLLFTLGSFQTDNDSTPESYTPSATTITSVKEASNNSSGQLSQIAIQAKQERKYLIPDPIGIVLLVHRLLGTTESNIIQEFAENNDILLSEYLQIPKGREVIYFI